MNILEKIIYEIAAFILAISPSTNYVEGVIGQPRSFLPHQTQTQTDKTISSLIYRGLFKYDIYGSLVPDLADSWIISDDGIIYTIKMKEGQTWTDGSPITSDDLIYTSFKSPELFGVATDKVDDLTVRYILPNKFSPFLSLFTKGIMKINSEEEQNPLKPISNGAFKILSVEESGPIYKQIILLNLDQSQEIRKLIFKYYPNEEEVVTAARLGEIDGFISSQDYEFENFEERNFPLQSVYYAIYFNLKNENFKDVEFRKKLRKALHVQEIAYDKGISAIGPISRNVFTDKKTGGDYYDKDYKENLQNALTITVPDVKSLIEVAQRIKAFWEEKLNMDIKIKTVDPDRFEKEIIETRNFEVLLYGQEIGRDPDRYVNWHSTQKDPPGLNLSGFEQVRADRALEEGRNEIDNDKRLTHYSEFQKVVDEQVPAIFLYHPHIKYYMNKYIKGIGDKYTFTAADRFLDFGVWYITKSI